MTFLPLFPSIQFLCAAMPHSCTLMYALQNLKTVSTKMLTVLNFGLSMFFFQHRLQIFPRVRLSHLDNFLRRALRILHDIDTGRIGEQRKFFLYIQHTRFSCTAHQDNTSNDIYASYSSGDASASIAFATRRRVSPKILIASL